MKYKLSVTRSFKKNLKKLSKVEQKQTLKKIEILLENPDHPSLRTKKIQGTDGIWESSINMDIRLIWVLEGEVVILMLDVGHHDILNKY